MNHCVPDFDIQIDDEEENPVLLSKKPSAARNNEIMELLWQNGSVVMHNQSHRQSKKPPSPVTNTGNQVIPDHREIRSSDAENFNINQHLFMQEDEMASWLFDSINEDPPIINTETLFHPSTGVIPGSSLLQSEQLLPQPIPSASRPPIHPARKEDQVLNRKHNNFTYFANHSNASIEPSISSSSMIPARQETTMVDSCDTPIITEMTNTASKLSETIKSTAYTECVSVSTAGKAAAYTGCGTISQVGKAATATTKGVKETSKLDITMTSSHDCSSGSVDPIQRKLELERKRKGRVSDKSELQRQEGKKQVRGSTSTKRSRAAEVHNLSERKRRDRINEKMKALQELIPRCNKSDKASMLDEAIEYLKSLQLQVQMMSMGCGMVPMMFPGMQQYMPTMGMRMGMGMGMSLGMEMGMNRPVMSFPNILPSSPLPPTTTTVATPYGSRFPVPPFHMPQPHVPTVPESSDNPLNSLGTLLPDQSRIPNTNFADPYQQFLGPHQLQQLIQGMNQQNVNRPGNSGGQGNSEKHQAG